MGDSSQSVRQAILDRVSRLRSITINADWIFRSRNAEQRSRVVLLRHDTLAALLEVADELDLPDLARDLEIAVERGGVLVTRNLEGEGGAI